MKLKDLFHIEYCEKAIDEESKDFIQKWHYSQSYKSLMQKHVFKLKQKDKTIGIAIFGEPIGKNCKNKYGNNILELRKLCLIDDTPKNSESFFISKTLKYLKKHTNIKKILSYTDPNMGHDGTIYKASNFKFLGMGDSLNPQIVIGPDKDYHLREMYQKKNGKYTKSALKIQELINKGKAKKVSLMNKFIYMYDLTR